MAGYISPHTPVPPLEDIPIPSADYFPGQNRTDYIYGFTIPYCLLAIFLAGCRIYVRRVLLNAVGLDDWLLLGSLTFTLANGSMGLWELRYGFGRHVIDIVRDGGNPHRLSIMSLIGPIFYNIAQLLIQQSILTFYLRLRVSFSKRLTYMIYGLMGASMLNTMGSQTVILILNFAQNGRLNNLRNFQLLWHMNSSFSMFIDLSIWFLPLPRIWRLENLSKRKRWALVATFSVGLFSCSSTMVRLCFVHVALRRYGDETWDRVVIHLMSVTESALAVSCASMATLRPLLSKWGLFETEDFRIPTSEDARAAAGGRVGQGSNTGESSKTSILVTSGKRDTMYAHSSRSEETVYSAEINDGYSEESADIAEDVGVHKLSPPHMHSMDSEARTEGVESTDIELGNLSNSVGLDGSEQDITTSTHNAQTIAPLSGFLHNFTLENHNGQVRESGQAIQRHTANSSGDMTEREDADPRSESTISFAAQYADLNITSTRSLSGSSNCHN